MVTILALAAAVLYGSADFLGGTATRRHANPIAVIAVSMPTGAILTLIVAVIAGSGQMSWATAGWAGAAGVSGALGLAAFYAGFAAAPMSVIAPVAALISTLLPVGAALAGGERPGLPVAIGGLVCIVAVVLVSLERPAAEAVGWRHRLRGLYYAVPAGLAFGFFMLFLRNAGTAGVMWPVFLARVAGALTMLAGCLLTRTRPLGRGDPGVLAIALASGVVDAAANACYVLATRAGMFGLAVVITSLYPGVTVLLARVLLGERMRHVQSAGLILAGVGVVLVTA